MANAQCGPSLCLMIAAAREKVTIIFQEPAFARWHKSYSLSRLAAVIKPCIEINLFDFNGSLQKCAPRSLAAGENRKRRLKGKS